MKRQGCCLWVFGGMFFFCLSLGFARNQYTILDLGSYNVSSINDSGEICGYKVVSSGGSLPMPSFQAYYWNTQHQVYSLAGMGSQVYDINNQGVIVGRTSSGATVWHNQSQQVVGSGFLASINNNGVAAGYSSNDSFFIWNGTIHSYAMPGIFNPPVAINDSGQVAINIKKEGGIPGWSYSQSGGIWENGIYTELPRLESSTLPYFCLTDINNNGKVIGFAHSGSIYGQPLLWENGTVKALNLPAGDSIGLAKGINDAGLVVGYSELGSSIQRNAVLWDELGVVKLKDLLVDSTGWDYLNDAVAINNNNQIIGYGYTTNGQGHAFLMLPIPEPATLILLLAGIAGLRKKA